MPGRPDEAPHAAGRRPRRGPWARADAAALVAAAEAGDMAALRRLLDAGVPVDARDARRRTALLAATHANRIDAARLLIERGADVNAKDDMQDSPFLYAGAQGRLEILRMTLAAGADLKSTNRYGGTALIPAAHHGHVETVRELLKTKIDVDHVNRLGWTALLEAIILGDGGAAHTEIVRLLVAHGAKRATGRCAGRDAAGACRAARAARDRRDPAPRRRTRLKPAGPMRRRQFLVLHRRAHLAMSSAPAPCRQLRPATGVVLRAPHGAARRRGLRLDAAAACRVRMRAGVEPGGREPGRLLRLAGRRPADHAGPTRPTRPAVDAGRGGVCQRPVGLVRHRPCARAVAWRRHAADAAARGRRRGRRLHRRQRRLLHPPRRHALGQGPGAPRPVRRRPAHRHAPTSSAPHATPWP